MSNTSEPIEPVALIDFFFQLFYIQNCNLQGPSVCYGSVCPSAPKAQERWDFGGSGLDVLLLLYTALLKLFSAIQWRKRLLYERSVEKQVLFRFVTVFSTPFWGKKNPRFYEEI